VGFPGAEDVDGDDLSGVFGGVMKGGVVGEAEVFAEPVESDASGHGEGIRLGERFGHAEARRGVRRRGG
jgi:hypothetical protein